MISAAFEFSGQLSLDAMAVPPPAFNSRVGSGSGSAIPKLASEGPMPRTRMRLLASPWTMKPAMRTLSPASTRMRVEIFAKCELEDGVAVGVEAGVAVAVAAGVAVAVAGGVGGAGWGGADSEFRRGGWGGGGGGGGRGAGGAAVAAGG